MKPFIILLAAFGMALLAVKLVNHNWNYIFAGNAAMSIMLVFTAIGHFVYSKGMAMMVPPSIPYKTAIVYLTGLIEIAAAIGLLIIALRHVTSILLVIFFVAILPANIYAALHKVDLQKATNEGSDARYLWFRIPLQLFFIAWVYFFGLYLEP